MTAREAWLLRPAMNSTGLLLLLLIQLKLIASWTTPTTIGQHHGSILKSPRSSSSSSSSLTATSTSTWFSEPTTTTTTASKAPLSLDRIKARVLQLGAALDRGQAYNPTSGDYYNETMQVAKETIDELIQVGTTQKTSWTTLKAKSLTLQDMQGEWELVLTTVPHGIFRSSPFFLAIQEAYTYAEEKESFGVDKSTLFFRLHELQTCSWGISKIGRVAQRIDASSGYLYSEFDTSIFSLTVIPILGWFKLLPTFGGCVVTAAKCQLVSPSSSTSSTTSSQDDWVLDMEVDYTTSLPVPGLSGLGEWIWNLRVPVGQIWKWLPWNQGRAATCQVLVKYLDEDFRIVQDVSGEYFCYTRPVVPRPWTLVEVDGKTSI